VLKLRCVFLKLRSGLELPLLRVAQAGDPAAPALTRYYSSALLAYVRKVLEVRLRTRTFENPSIDGLSRRATPPRIARPLLFFGAARLCARRR